jgi:L-ascorbate metabolism protein UlaG (beta-lactamase superfamily)
MISAVLTDFNYTFICSYTWFIFYAKYHSMLLGLIFLLILLIVYLFVRQPSFGRLATGNRLEKIKQSPHYNNGSFKNLSETAMMIEGVSMWKIIKEMYFKKHPDVTPSHQLPYVKKSFAPIGSGQPEITWFGHSSYLLQVNDLNILVDPVFSERASPVSYVGAKAFGGSNVFGVDDLPPIDVVVISHDHYDHLDYHVIKQLKKRAPLFITAIGVGAHLEFWGVDPKKVKELDWWESFTTPQGFEFTATPARHFSGRGFNRNQSLWASYVLRTGKYRIFIGGDSGYDTHFALIGEKYGPFDIAILEDGQYNEMWPNIHMFPEETVQAAIDLKAKILLPVHWGKYSLSIHPWNEPIERAVKKAADLQVKIVTPMIGETIIIQPISETKYWWR